MEITRCVFVLASGVSRPCRQFVRARKIRITYNITVCTDCTRRVSPLANTITVRRTGHRETLQYVLLRINSLYIE